MANKKDILKNIFKYNAEELAAAIKAGDVTLYELSKTGNLLPSTRRRINAILARDGATGQQPAPSSDEPSSPSEQPISPSDEPSAPGNPPAPSEQVGWESTGDDTQEATYGSSATSQGVFQKPFSFQGRIRRTEYLLTAMLLTIYSIVINFIALALSGLKMEEVMYNIHALSNISLYFAIYGLLVLPGIYFSLTQGCKRCHDFGLTGWLQLVPLFPIVMLFVPGQPGANKYGENPR